VPGNPHIRARIVRLLRGEFYAADLPPLFLYARDRCNGRDSVKEVGDFIAHMNERTKGIATSLTREWQISAWFQYLIWQGALDFHHLLPTFPEFLRASFRRADPGRIKAAINLSKKEARTVLSALLERITINTDGSLALLEMIGREFKLLQCLTSHLSGGPAFDNEQLFSDLVTILVREGDLLQSETKQFGALKPGIGLFAVSIMHGCTIDVGDGSKILLNASHHPADGLGVLAAVPVLIMRPDTPLPAGSFASIPGLPERAIMLSTAIFTTNLVANEYCTPKLLATPMPWGLDMTLEVTNDMRLGIIS
jgi:hypothetical protein